MQAPRTTSKQRERLACGLLSLLLWCGSAGADPAQAPASQAPAQQRPRICLVLSGGGARGAAHVGVLKALEELHIPIDCIAGTSLGASVGGLYAAGMTADELEQQLNQPSVQADMADNPPRDRLTYRTKQDQLKYLLRLEFGYDDGRFFFPRGIINGNDPGRILNVLSLALQPDTDFDKLPIPFRAVATDVETGNMVVLDHGNLAESMRASMAVPGLYPPVPIGNNLLVDGGLTRNLPVDVARKMGADVVIAVNIGTPLAKSDQLGDVVSVSLQVIKILGNQNVADSIATLTPKDVLLQPDMGDIGATDFDRMGEAVKLGEHQTRDALKGLTALQLSPADYAAYAASHRQVPATPAKIDFVVVEGNQKILPSVILARFGVQAGAPWDLNAVDTGLQHLYELGYFQSVDATLVTSNGGQTGIRLTVKEKAWQPNYLQFGLHIADDFEGGSIYELLGDYTRTEINHMGAEWRNEFEIGNSRYLYTELYQPLDYAGRFFLAPQAEYLNQTFDVFSGNERIAEYSVKFPHAGLDFGVAAGHAGEARLGFLFGHVIAEPRIGDPTLPTYSNTLMGPRLRLSLDTFDSISFPSDGSYLFLNGFFPRQSLGSDAMYDKLDLTLGRAFGSGPDSLLVLAEGGTSLGTTLPPYEQFGLGGFLSLAGYRQGQLRGDRVFDTHFIFSHRAATLPTGLGKGLYFGAGIDAGNVWSGSQRASLGDLQYGASVFVGADTVLGPLYLGVGAGKGGNRNFFLYLGIPVNGNTLAPSFGN